MRLLLNSPWRSAAPSINETVQPGGGGGTRDSRLATRNSFLVRFRLPPLTFRGKILLSLVGTVVLLVGTSSLIVRHQMHRQVAEQVERAMTEAGRAFDEVERLRNEELERYGRRFTGSIRLPAALDAALEADDASILADAAEYELALAGLDRGLVVFSDTDGKEIAMMRDGAHDPGAGEIGVESLVRDLLESGEPRLTGYHLADGVLFTVHVYPLVLVDHLVGALTLGFPFGDEEARRLGEVLGAEVCLRVARACVASTRTFARGALASAVAHVPPDTTITGEWGAAPWAIISESLTADAGTGVGQVIGLPLEEVLRPFDRIRRAERFAGFAALGLALALGVLLSHGLTGPVRVLVGATDRVRRGEYDFRIAMPSRDELGRLGEAFNEMLRDLALKERYRGVLDKVVSRDVAEELLKGEVRLGGETREVSTLFADIRGFTSLTERLDPHDVVVALNEWFDVAALAVEAENGVVDKFLGDGLMAIFGAPLAQEDHALRAVRAALRMREDLEALNARRQARAAPPLRVGIGIATGMVVAGNTGSQNRLNYTVLGEPVNLAARLCAEARASEILASEATRRHLGGDIDAIGESPRRVKGISQRVRPWLVRSLASGAAAALLLGGLTDPAAARQIVPEPPTLQELGIEYISPSGWFQLLPSGGLDLAYYRPAGGPPWLIPETDPFVGLQLRLFADAFFGERVYATTELRVDRGDEPAAGPVTARIQQAFVRVTLDDGWTLRLQAGKFITPFGSHPGRRHTAADPFIRPPLHYDHRTVIGTNRVAAGLDGFLGWKRDPAEFRQNGVPVVWGTPYPTGILLFGGRGPISFRLALVNSVPSSEPDQWDPSTDGLREPSWIGTIGYQVSPELRLAASYAAGPYLRRGVADPNPEAGPTPADRFRSFEQRLLSADGTFTRGMIELRGEIVRDVWQLPYVDEDAVDVSWYVEGKAKTRGGLYGALRFGAIHFNEIAASAGTEAWDYDVRRWQVASGYRLARTIELRAEYLRNHTDSPVESGADLFSLELGWRF